MIYKTQNVKYLIVDVKMTIFIYSFLLVTCIYNVAILSRLDKLGEL
jgi:hypothetical protein